MDTTVIIGIDCATADKRIGLATGIVESDRCVVSSAGVCSGEREVADEVASLITGKTRALLAFDAPLGWPRAMGEIFSTHRAGEPIAIAAHSLFRRETDRFVKEKLGKQSLDVGADRIARTAHSALHLMGKLRQMTGLPIPLAWTPAFSDTAAAIEVYPAATLISHGIKGTGYKKKDNIAERKVIIAFLEQKMELPESRELMEKNADALDAALCVLAGFNFLRGEAYGPEDTELAVREGWIWVRAKRK